MNEVHLPRFLTASRARFSRCLRAVSVAVVAVPVVVFGSGVLGAGVANAAVATHFSVTAPANATTGAPVAVTVRALDAGDGTDTAYSGTVHFTSTDSDAVLPADSTFSSGIGTFDVTFRTAGNKKVTVTDRATGSITGTSGSVSVSQSATTHLSVVASTSATISGTALTVTVKALNASGIVVPGFGGTVHLTSTDAAAGLPANATLPNGQRTFTVTLKTAGTQTVTAKDVVSSVTGTTGGIVVSPGNTTHLLVTAPSGAGSGAYFFVVVTAKDANQNTVPSFGGSVHLTSSDSAAVLGLDSTLLGGVHDFAVTLKTLGTRTITATDVATPSIKGVSGAITVAVHAEPVRAAGSDRVGTAVAVSKLDFPNGGAGAVILARSDDYPDALVAAPLAATTKAPLLFTEGSVLPTETIAEIARVLGAHGTIYLIGSTAAIPANINTTLSVMGYSTVRIGGVDRYSTAVAVANALGSRTTVFLATGNNFPDALSAGPAAAHAGGVVLLTDGSALAPVTVAYMNAHAGTVYAVGGPAAAADPGAIRLVGTDRFGTAVAVASKFFPTPTTFGVASGVTFADAVSGGAYLARAGGPILLTAPTTLPSSISNYISGVKSGAVNSSIIGGTASISLGVQTEIDQALGY